MKVDYIARRHEQPYHVTYYDGMQNKYAVINAKSFPIATAKALEAIEPDKRNVTIVTAIREWQQ